MIAKERQLPGVPGVEEFHQLIWKQANIAWSKMPRGHACGMDLEDLYAEGLLAYAKFRVKYDPARAKFITGFYVTLWRHLAHVVKQAWRQSKYEWLPTPSDDERNPLESVEAGPAYVHQLTNELFGRNRLSRDAWLVVRAVLDPSPNLARYIQEHRAAGRTHRYLIYSFLGLNRNRSRDVEHEIRRLLEKSGAFSPSGV